MRRFPVRAVVVGVALLGAAGLAVPAVASSASGAGVRYSALPRSVAATTDVSTGAFTSKAMSVEVVLAPSHGAQLQSLLASVYNSRSPDYQHWLQKGQFDARFAPSRAESSAVARYLRASGLTVTPSSSPFLVRATGPSSRVSSAFRTSLRTFRDPRGITYFSNASAVKLPTSLARGVLGVVGLSNTVRMHSMVQRAPSSATAAASSKTSCETGYPTRKQLYKHFNKGAALVVGYGGGPGCSGLTPSQDNSIYSAPHVGARGKGAGVNIAVFELSAYRHSDIVHWAHTFYGPSYTPPLVNVNVDGGPLHPVCPTGDTCPPFAEGYAGDIEVDADIETQLAVAPDVKKLIVYNAPNDETGQTELAEYTRIASNDRADAVSSSWGLCENDAGTAYAQAENVLFEQMALQGQSMFGDEGDTGAFGCIRSDGTTIVNVQDPGAQPWVTGVGGTTLDPFNPGKDAHPAYPKGVEAVWNVDKLCNTSADEGGHPGVFWCAATGAGGGGNSEIWGRPFYQHGPGVTNTFTEHGNGTTACALAKIGKPCREVPDISADADEFTPYSEFCTGNAHTPNSVCATISSTPHGWFGIGGTSLSTPLWSAIFADRDSFMGHRSGNANPLLYTLFNLNSHLYFHDITGKGELTHNNGLYPTTRGYDLATGIGTPVMWAIITKSG